jgi:hypothetical protein
MWSCCLRLLAGLLVVVMLQPEATLEALVMPETGDARN